MKLLITLLAISNDYNSEEKTQTHQGLSASLADGAFQKTKEFFH